MCVTSMIMDHYRDRWYPYVIPSVPFQPLQTWPILQPGTLPTFQLQPSPISADEIAEFRLLLERARAYDKRNHEPDCELEEKRAVLRRIAAALGLDISFIESPQSADAVDPVDGVATE